MLALLFAMFKLCITKWVLSYCCVHWFGRRIMFKKKLQGLSIKNNKEQMFYICFSERENLSDDSHSSSITLCQKHHTVRNLAGPLSWQGDLLEKWPDNSEEMNKAIHVSHFKSLLSVQTAHLVSIRLQLQGRCFLFKYSLVLVLFLFFFSFSCIRIHRSVTYK